jgi:hypothetical protein
MLQLVYDINTYNHLTFTHCHHPLNMTFATSCWHYKNVIFPLFCDCCSNVNKLIILKTHIYSLIFSTEFILKKLLIITY